MPSERRLRSRCLRRQTLTECHIPLAQKWNYAYGLLSRWPSANRLNAGSTTRFNMNCFATWPVPNRRDNYAEGWKFAPPAFAYATIDSNLRLSLHQGGMAPTLCWGSIRSGD